MLGDCRQGSLGDAGPLIGLDHGLRPTRIFPFELCFEPELGRPRKPSKPGGLPGVVGLVALEGLVGFSFPSVQYPSYHNEMAMFEEQYLSNQSELGHAVLRV